MRTRNAIICTTSLAIFLAARPDSSGETPTLPRRDASTGPRQFYYTNYTELLRNDAINGMHCGFSCTVRKEALPFLPSDFLTNLFDEVRCDGFRSLVCEPGSGPNILRLKPDFMVSACDGSVEVSICFACRKEDCESREFKTFQERVRFYIGSRAEGHSTNYVWSALMQRRTNDTSWPLGWPTSLREEHWVPRSWVKPLDDDYWLVVEGTIAWRYDRNGNVVVRDAQEYDPRLRDKFLKAEEEVAKARPTSSAVHDLLLQELLLRKFAIHWTTPYELSPLNRKGQNF